MVLNCLEISTPETHLQVGVWTLTLVIGDKKGQILALWRCVCTSLQSMVNRCCSACRSQTQSAHSFIQLTGFVGFSPGDTWRQAGVLGSGCHPRLSLMQLELSLKLEPTLFLNLLMLARCRRSNAPLRHGKPRG